MSRSLAVLTIILASTAFGAEDYPTLGLVYNTKEWASLNYECDLVNPSLLECVFTQVGVRRKASDADLARLLAQARSGTPEKVGEKHCAEISQYIAAAEGRGKLPMGTSLPESAERRTDLLTHMKAARAYCEKPTPENLDAVVRAGHDPESRTCLVRSWTFKQSFAPVVDAARQKKSWVVKSTPSGVCGIVQLDRFERETLSFAPEMPLWRYVARKAITNPAGERFPGMKCSDMDEDTYVYSGDITKNNHTARCDYIEFSVF